MWAVGNGNCKKNRKEGHLFGAVFITIFVQKEVSPSSFFLTINWCKENYLFCHNLLLLENNAPTERNKTKNDYKKKQSKKISRLAECEIPACFGTSITHKIRHIKKDIFAPIYFAVQITSAHYFQTCWHFFLSFSSTCKLQHGPTCPCRLFFFLLFATEQPELLPD